MIRQTAGVLLQTFPPNVAVISERNVGENDVLVQAGRIDGAQTAVGTRFDPGDVVANGRTLQPSKPAGGTIMEKLVLPQALGNAAATWYFLPCGLVTPKISMCSASQPGLPVAPSEAARPMFDAMRSAKHFLPSKAFPP